jgi:hypothetical protein
MARILLVENGPLASIVTAEAFLAGLRSGARRKPRRHALQLIATAPFDLAFISMKKDNSGGYSRRTLTLPCFEGRIAAHER